MTALLMIPITGLAGLAVDYALRNQVISALSLAANGAALNAVKIAAASLQSGNANYVADGVTAGNKWFAAQISAQGYAGAVNDLIPSVSITTTATSTLTAKVTFTGTLQSVFGLMFSVVQYPLSVEADATMVTTPYLNVEILLDNSSSMQIGATDADMLEMMQLTPCAFSDATTNAQIGAAAYSGYQWVHDTTYDGALSHPISTPAPFGGKAYLYPTFEPGSVDQQDAPGPTCKGVLPPNADGTYPTAVAPCAFACHTDNSKPAGSGHDYYAVARSTIGVTGVTPVTLRFDVVKAATRTVISTMQNYDLSFNNLGVGIFDFSLNLNADYPMTGPLTGGQLGLSGEAGGDWAAATAAVGGPPTTANGPDTGIQPADLSSPGATHADTDIAGALSTLANALSPAGNGALPTTPRKVLFLITDGFDDHTGYKGPVAVADCDTFKQMGYRIYVIYTPYEPLMHLSWLDLYNGIAAGPPSLSDNLQACASNSNDYIEATDQASLTAALQKFLQSALTTPAVFTK